MIELTPQDEAEFMQWQAVTTIQVEQTASRMLEAGCTPLEIESVIRYGGN